MTFKSIHGSMQARTALCKRIIDMVSRPDLHNLTKADMAFGVNLVKVNAPPLYDRARNEMALSLKRRGALVAGESDLPQTGVLFRREKYYSPEEYAQRVIEQKQTMATHSAIRTSNRRDVRVKQRWLEAREKLRNE